ncbi:MAG: aminopeptidase [Pseudomonadota bacterium]|nr:aminopeptidase [Pseudomonadota bacterium]
MLRDSLSRLTRRLVLALACAGMSGCYYLHVAGGQLEMNRRRAPIEEVMARPETDAALRRRLDYASRARDFAMTELGLPDNGSYRTYADLDRPYATWNLFAAPEFSVKPRSWCFPIAGCVAYRGYFDEAKAERAAARLAQRGFDVYVGPAIAYSTLGHLRDPVLNTMLAYGDRELAALIIHELAHQAVYAPGDSDFNEAFATVVEIEGLRRWLAAGVGGGTIEDFLRARRRQDAVADAMIESRARLEVLYARAADEEAMRAAKAAELEQLRATLAAAGLARAGVLNNARLVAAAAYHRCVPALTAELVRLGNDLPAFYSVMKLLERDAPARGRLCPPA